VPDDEIIALRVTETGGPRYMDDYSAVWPLGES